MLCTAFDCVRFKNGIEEETGVGIKNNLKLPSSTSKYFNSLRDETDEAIYIYNNEMCFFCTKEYKKQKMCILKQYCRSFISDKLYIISTELNLRGNVCEILYKYFEFMNNYFPICDMKTMEILNQEDRLNYFNDLPSKLTLHNKLKESDLNEAGMDFDATSSYPTAMWDRKPVYPKIESGFAF